MTEKQVKWKTSWKRQTFSTFLKQKKFLLGKAGCEDMDPTCERCPNELIYWVKWDVKILLKIETIEEYKILNIYWIIMIIMPLH